LAPKLNSKLGDDIDREASQAPGLRSPAGHAHGHRIGMPAAGNAVKSPGLPTAR